jgi:outer membrane protein
MRRLYKLVLFIFLISYSSNVFANDKFAYIDMNLLINTSEAGKYISRELTKMHKKKIEKFKNIEKNLKKAESDLLSKKNVISKEEFDKKLTQLRKEASDYNKERKKSNNLLSKKEKQATANLISLIQPMLSEYAAQNSILIIFPKKNIVIGKSDLDITNKILVILNQKHKKINIE